MNIKRIELDSESNLITCFDGSVILEIEKVLLGIKNESDLIDFIQMAGGLDETFKLINYQLSMVKTNLVQ